MIDYQLCGASSSRGRKSFKVILVIGLLFGLFGSNTVFSANSYAQNKRLTLELTNTSMRAVFNEIEKNSEYIFFYSDEVNVFTKVAVNVKDRTIEEIMSQVLKNTNYTYTISDRQVFVKLKAEVKPASVEVEVTEQNITVNGIVSDKVGDPIIGANVVVKGNSTVGTITDIDGKFSLNVPQNAVLVISYIGYKTQEVSTRGNTPLNIVLEDDAAMMDEVVVVGYGTQKKVNLTGSLSTVSSKDIVGRTNTNLLQSLQGTAPGVTIISRPGQTPAINIRGRGNLGTSSPLYVIDGAISTAEAFANLDPNAIETVSILKDAASSAIYGSRAAYGVVLVTTKQGTQEGFKIDYSGLVGFKRQTTKPKVVSSAWEAILTNEAYENAGKTAPIPGNIIDIMRNGSQPDLYPNTDWWDLVFNDNVINTSHTISFSGSSGKTSYFTSIGYAYDDAFRMGESTDRYNVNSNLSSQLTSWLKIRTNIKYTEHKLDRTTGDFPVEHVTQISPGFVARQSTGEWGTVHNGGWATKTDVVRNPLRIAEEGGWMKRDQKFITLDGAIDINLYKGLVLTGQVISDMRDYKQKKYDAFLPAVAQFPIPNFPTPGFEGGRDQKESKMEYDWQDFRRMIYNAFVNYDWSNNVHNIKALAAMSYEHYNYQQQKSSRKDFPTNSMTGMNGGSSAPGMVAAEGPLHEEKLMSYFGRVNYDFMGKYLVEANFRGDASSRFHKDQRWGFFPSFSAGWRVSEEDFMKSISWVDNLKLRGSWGQLGNINNVGRYDYFATYAVGKNNYNFGNVAGSSVREEKIPNDKLGWETVTMTNIGLDVSLLGNRLNVTADWYMKKTSDILLEYDIIREVGSANKVSQNIGELKNRGIELAVAHNNTIGEVSYSVYGNFSKNWNKVTYLGGLDKLNPSMWVTAVGYPIGEFYGYKTDGLVTQEDLDNGYKMKQGAKQPAPGDVKYIDLDGDNELTDKDKTFLGKDVPDITYGLGLTLEYKNFDFSMFGQGVSGAKVYFIRDQASPFFDNAPPREYHKKRWTKENPNPNAAYPRLLPTDHVNFDYNTQNYSDFWLYSADYFRIKTMTLGYTLPKSIINKWGITNLRVYLSSENPFTFRGDKRMEDFDPETAGGRGNLMTGMQSFNFGVNVSF